MGPFNDPFNWADLNPNIVLTPIKRQHKMTPPSNQVRIANLRRRIEALEARVAQYGVDEYEVGNVLVYDKQFNGGDKTYTYAVLKTPTGWYLTGRSGHVSMGWDELIDYVLDNAAFAPVLYVVTELEQHVPT